MLACGRLHYDVCRSGLMGGRYEAAELPPNERGFILWGIRDHEQGGDWVENGGEREYFGDRQGALGWVDRQRYLDEARLITRP